MAAEHTVSAALEDYLETILGLGQEKGAARVRDIAAGLAVHKSTVSAALHSLADKGLVNYAPYERVTLTPAGQRIAEAVRESHGVIRWFLSDVLQLDEEAAQRNACRMEHVVDREVMDRLALFARYLAQSPRAAAARGRRFAAYIRAGRRSPPSAAAGGRRRASA